MTQKRKRPAELWISLYEEKLKLPHGNGVWVVLLEKVGYRMEVYRSAPGIRQAAWGLAKQLAQFLGAELIESPSY